MSWLQSHLELETHPKVNNMMVLLGWERDKVLGFLHRFWWWCLKYAEDGDLRKYRDEIIAVNLNVDMAAIKALYDCRIDDKHEGFIDRQDRKVHDWVDIVGPYLYSKYHNSNPQRYREIIRKYKTDEPVRKKHHPETENIENTIKDIIEHINKKTGKDFDYKAKSSRQFLSARLKEGATSEDCILVVDYKYFEWWNNPEMRDYVQPTTLFRPTKFDGYLTNARYWKKKNKKTDDGLGKIEEQFK